MRRIAITVQILSLFLGVALGGCGRAPLPPPTTPPALNPPAVSATRAATTPFFAEPRLIATHPPTAVPPVPTAAAPRDPIPVAFAPHTITTTLTVAAYLTQTREYVLSAEAGQLLLAGLEPRTQPGAAFYLRGADGRFLTPGAGAGMYALPATQPYFIGVQNTTEKPVRLRLVLAPGTVVEAAERIVLAAGAPSAVLRGEARVGHIKQFVVAGRAGQILRLSQLPSGGAFIPAVYGADGSVLLNFDAGNTRLDQQFVLPATQDYVLSLLPLNARPASETVTYHFGISLTSSPGTAGVASPVVVEVTATPPPLGYFVRQAEHQVRFEERATAAVLHGTLPSRTGDAYRFDARAGQWLFAAVEAMNAGAGLRLGRDGAPTSGADALPYALQPLQRTGTHTLEVINRDAFTAQPQGTIPYTLTLRLQTITTTQVLTVTLGNPATVTAAMPSTGLAQYTFTAAAGYTATLRVLAPNDDIVYAFARTRLPADAAGSGALPELLFVHSARSNPTFAYALPPSPAVQTYQVTLAAGQGGAAYTLHLTLE